VSNFNYRTTEIKGCIDQRHFSIIRVVFVTTQWGDIFVILATERFTRHIIPLRELLLIPEDSLNASADILSVQGDCDPVFCAMDMYDDEKA
jgi:hypothetical protein